ncbi:inhibitor of growth protein 1-like [Phymastichus coffea]|uniref:inhibitor of growth protein 1-like n=1 Tax=Phymastichus coffea TaxID=108790 RepID=UPI00273BC63F|nr:inhibitor of growth protein 1-like [Phymastichus coffea]
MLSQAIVDTIYSTKFIQNYFDCIENLPLQLQRYLSRLRELDATCQIYLREIDQQQEELSNPDIDVSTKSQALKKLMQALIYTQEIGDEKLHIVQIIQDLVESRTKQLDVNFEHIDALRDQESNQPIKDPSINTNINANSSNSNNEKSVKRVRRTRAEMESAQAMDLDAMSENPSSSAVNSSNGNQRKANATNTSKKKKRKSRHDSVREDTPPLPDEEIDPNEPTYCLCDQISYGEMIMCDNDLCPIEWFHFSCVSLSTKPKGKWFCPKCRGDRPNIMKPKAQFLKELALYNKEKEEKS